MGLDALRQLKIYSVNLFRSAPAQFCFDFCHRYHRAKADPPAVTDNDVIVFFNQFHCVQFAVVGVNMFQMGSNPNRCNAAIKSIFAIAEL
jgi:hypothetical protein